MNETCGRFEEWLPDYRWLNPMERQALDRHLAQCPRCREEYREAQMVGEWFAQQHAAVPAGFADGVMAALERQQPAVAGKMAVGVLLTALAAEIALAAGLHANPAVLWDKATAVGSAFWSGWCLPLLTGWRGSVTSLLEPLRVTELQSQFNVMWLAGGLLLVVLFAWITINRGRTENA